ncbi:MAG: hypothetical protein JXX14_06015 [Deltaproteobacteria bacterium]|nr:hypothetical protein [Deltaproteobacteria bacterium]
MAKKQQRYPIALSGLQNSKTTPVARKMMHTVIPLCRLFTLAILISGCGCNGHGGSDAEEDTDSCADAAVCAAPPLDRGVATNMRDASSFLYTGSDPFQLDVDETVLDDPRISVIRGKVSSRDGEALRDVVVSVHGHPEYGYTRTRKNGQYDFVLNGGESVTVDYRLKGHLPVHRTLYVGTQKYEWAPAVVMIQRDVKSTKVVANGGDYQVIRGTVTSDRWGERRSTLLIPPGTLADATLSNGETTPLISLTVRATEYTVGDNGPETMPSSMPTSVGYTYAVELSIDEADGIGAKTVTFSQPLPYYVENFLDFPTGTTVPFGYYNRDTAQWVASESGKVIALVDADDQPIGIDMDGDGEAESVDNLSSLGVTEEELTQLSKLFTPGQSLWRVLVPHFSTWDCNWPFGPPEGARAPELSLDKTLSSDNPCAVKGSVIFPETQVLGESIPLVGSDYQLHCLSDRGTSRRVDYEIDIPLVGDIMPASLKAVELEVLVAGQRYEQRFDAATNLNHTYIWDGLDAFGRKVQGQTEAIVRVGYVYDGSYTNTSQFGLPGTTEITGSRTREEVTLWSEDTIALGAWDAMGLGLGGFSLNVHHAYNPVNKRLILGNGRQRKAASVAQVARDIADPSFEMNMPDSLLVAPDGRVFYTDDGEGVNQVLVITADGAVEKVAGTGEIGNDGDGGLAVNATLNEPQGLYLKSDGTLLVSSNDRIRAISPDGTIQTIAGGGETYVYDNEAIPATEVTLTTPDQLAVGMDGSLYVAELGGNRVMRIDTAGDITAFAGGGWNDPGGLATDTWLDGPSGLAIASDGAVYISERYADRIVRVSPSGLLSVVVDQSHGLYGPRSIAFAPDGALLISDENNNRVVRWDGQRLTTVVGGGDETVRGGIAARNARIPTPDGITMGADGSLYIASDRILRINPALPGLGATDIALPSLSGAELFVFDGSGRHMETRDGFTGAKLRSFEYNEHGLLAAIREPNGSKTLFNRDESNLLQSVTSPTGVETQFTLNEKNRIIESVDPLNRTLYFEYDKDGLLVAHTDAMGGKHQYDYDIRGLLVADSGPTGFSQTLKRDVTTEGTNVTIQSPLGRTRQQQTTHGEDGGFRQTVTSAAGDITVVTHDATLRITQKNDGTIITETLIPDLRFQMQVPFVNSRIITTPEGRTLKITATQIADDKSSIDNPEPLMWSTETLVGSLVAVNTYDKKNRTIRAAWGDSRTLTREYDDHGRLNAVSPSGWPATSFSYNSQGLLSQMILTSTDGADTRKVQYTYDDNGYIKSMINPVGDTVTLTNDVAGRIVSYANDDDNTTLLGYTNADWIASVTPPEKDAHHQYYDDAGLMTAYVPPLLDGAETRTAYSYDDDQMITDTLLSDARSIHRMYDAAGRLSEVSVAAGKYQLTYDASSGKLTDILTPQGNRVADTYDGPLFTAMSWSGDVSGKIQFDYNDNFDVSSISVNDNGETRLTYDNAGAIVSAGPVIITRNDASGLPEKIAAENQNTSFMYNGFAELAGQVATVSGEQLFSGQYTRDTIGRIIAIAETIDADTKEVAYTYDNAGRLIEVTESINGGAFQTRTYIYDANGNRLSVQSSGQSSGDIVSAAYDAQDRIIQYGDQQFKHGIVGDLQRITDTGSGETTDYTYDELGQLLQVSLPNGDKIDYVYDLPGRRIAKNINGTQTEAYIYLDQLRPAAKLDSAGNVIQQYIYAIGINVPDVIMQDGDTYAVIRDHVGSVRMVVNANTGDIAQRVDYDEFGVVTNDTNPGFQPFGFAGGLYDSDTGLVHFNARDYNPAIGRWTAKDPILFGGGDTNLYGYVFSDPVNLIDPNGEFAWVLAGIAVGVLAGGFASKATGGFFVDGALIGGLTGLAVTTGAIVAGGGAAGMIVGGYGGFIGSAAAQGWITGEVDWASAAVSGISGGFFSGVPVYGVGQKLGLLVGQNGTELFASVCLDSAVY